MHCPELARIRSSCRNLSVKLGVAARRPTPRHVSAHPIRLELSPERRLPEGGMSTTSCSRQIVGGHRAELESGRHGVIIQVGYAVFETTDAGHNRNRTISQGAKLRQTARLEARRDHQRIRSSLDKVGQRFIIPGYDTALPCRGFRRASETDLKTSIAGSEQDKLNALAKYRR